MPTEGRLSGLDGLRVFAVLLVVLYHQDLIPFGWVGVQIFFVLSGFLITRLLWAARDQPLRTYLISFYGRRTLRIVPLYYGALVFFAVASWLTHKGEIYKASIPYLVTYTYNLWSATGAYRASRIVSHLWSLSVEEQFYLVWPLFLFAFRRRNVKPLLAAIVLAGPLIRLAEVLLLRSWSGANPLIDADVYVLTPTYLDAFAIGALVALFPLGGMRSAFFASLALLATTTYVALSRAPGMRDVSGFGPGYVLIWGYSLLNLCSALLIDCLVHRKLAPRLFDSKPMRYLGRISYGLYVFHLPIQTTLEQIAPSAGVAPRLLVEIVLTIAVSAVSFRFWEQPFLARKERWFPMRGRDHLSIGK